MEDGNKHKVTQIGLTAQDIILENGGNTWFATSKKRLKPYVNVN